MKKKWYNCWLFHEWENWSPLKTVRVLQDGRYVGQAQIQHRVCSLCGCIESRTIDE